MVSSRLDSQRLTSHPGPLIEDYQEDRKWDDVKSECVRVLKAWGYSTKAKKFEECSEDYAVFECQECNSEFCAPITCGLRVCPSCRSRIRGRFVDELEEYVKDVNNHRHMVLTVPNLPSDSTIGEIREKIKEVKKSLGKLRRRKYFDKRVKGVIYGIEVKEGDNGFNIHLHCFLALDGVNYIDYEKIKDYWLEYFPNASRGGQEFREHKNSKNCLVEVVSYATKGAYFETGRNMAKWVIATNGTRLIGRTGCFYDIIVFREKKYIECPFCGSKEVLYIGKWSELVLNSVSKEPPPTINEIKEGRE